MEIERVWAMPSRHTFTIAPIARLIQREIPAGEKWVDAFAGFNSPAFYTNDLNPASPAVSHQDAVVFLRGFSCDSVDGVLFDAPYSPRQLKECYDNIGQSLHDTKASVWASWKDEIARIIRPLGKCISFGWNTNGLGIGRGFIMERVLLVAHGGMHNDTIVTVEKKL